MSTIKDFIDIQITRNTRAVSRASFSIPCFIFTYAYYTDRAREYSDLAGVAGDFGTDSPAYKAAQRFFGGQVTPAKIVIGRRQPNQADVSVATVSNSTEYSMTINGNPYTYTSDSTATATEIAAGLIAAASTAQGVTFTDNGNGTFKVVNTDSSVDFSFTGTGVSGYLTSNLLSVSFPESAIDSWPTAINAVQAANDSWYYLTTDEKSTGRILDIAEDIQAKDKIYGVSTNDAYTLTNATDSIAAEMKARGLDHSFIMYSADAAKYPECALIGSQAQAVPGSNTWAFKSLAGIAPDRLTANQSANARNNNLITYENIGGVNVTTSGKTCGGEYIDVMVGISWTRSRMQEGIWFVLANSQKIPYTQAGISQIETQVRKVLAEGIRNGLYTDNPAPVVIVPDAATVDANLRASRTLDAITFEARLAGAIEKVIIRGTVNV